EMALPTLLRAASRRRISEPMREATARPAASSAGLVILLPELRRERDLLKRDSLRPRLCAETCAVMLVLMIMWAVPARLWNPPRDEPRVCATAIWAARCCDWS